MNEKLGKKHQGSEKLFRVVYQVFISAFCIGISFQTQFSRQTKLLDL